MGEINQDCRRDESFLKIHGLLPGKILENLARRAGNPSDFGKYVSFKVDFNARYYNVDAIFYEYKGPAIVDGKMQIVRWAAHVLVDAGCSRGFMPISICREPKTPEFFPVHDVRQFG